MAKFGHTGQPTDEKSFNVGNVNRLSRAKSRC